MIMNKEVRFLKDLDAFLGDYINILEDDIDNKQLRRLERGFKKLYSDMENHSVSAQLNKYEFVNDFHKEHLKNYFEQVLKYIESIIRDIQALRDSNGYFGNGVEQYIEDMRFLQTSARETVETLKYASIGMEQIDLALKIDPKLIDFVNNQLITS